MIIRKYLIWLNKNHRKNVVVLVVSSEKFPSEFYGSVKNLISSILTYYLLILFQSIEFSINRLSTENRLSHRTPKPYKIKVNNCKLIDLVIRIELTWAILMLRFSNFLRNSIIQFCMFLYLETYFLRVTVSFLCRLQAVS